MLRWVTQWSSNSYVGGSNLGPDPIYVGKLAVSTDAKQLTVQGDCIHKRGQPQIEPKISLRLQLFVLNLS